MVTKLDDFISKLTSLSDADAIWQATANLASDLGYSGCALAVCNKGPDGIENPRMQSNFSDEFNTEYSRGGLGNIDPFLMFACDNFLSKRIGTKDFSTIPDPTLMHHRFLDLSSENNAVGGLGVPVRAGEGNIFGGWCFVSGESDAKIDLLNAERGREVQLAGVLAYERMLALGLGSLGNDTLLSPRERECLLWLCAGFRVSQIANKLSVSDSAVNLYIANAKQKLHARTREQAVARAIFSGEINL